MAPITLVSRRPPAHSPFLGALHMLRPFSALSVVVCVGVVCGGVLGGPLPRGSGEMRPSWWKGTCDAAFAPPALFLGAAPAASRAGGSPAVCQHPARLGMLAGAGAGRHAIRSMPAFSALRMSGDDAASEEERLRDEMASLLGKSGRDIGMKAMKAPKGSLANLRSRIPKSSSPAVPSPETPSSPEDATLPPPTRPGGSAATPPVARPAPRSPHP